MHVNMMCTGRAGQGGQHRVQVAGGVSNILIFQSEQGLDLFIYFYLRFVFAILKQNREFQQFCLSLVKYFVLS